MFGPKLKKKIVNYFKVVERGSEDTTSSGLNSII